MQRLPRDPQAPVLTGELVWYIVLVGTLILNGAFGLFEWELIGGTNTAQAHNAPIGLASWGRIVLYGLFTYLIVESKK